MPSPKCGPSNPGENYASASSPPRSSTAGQDSNSLSFEVVKICLETGLPHSLMFALERIRLEDPMASATASALLKPLEIFTRVSVYNNMAEREKTKKKSATNTELALPTLGGRRSTMGPSQRSESAFADEDMLEDGFDADTAANEARNSQRSARREFEEMVDMMGEDFSDQDDA